MSADSDIDAILLDGPDSFSDGTTTSATKLWENDEIQGQDQAGVIVGLSYVLLRSSQYPSLATRQPVTVNGKRYAVSQKMRIQDGRLLQVFLGDIDAGQPVLDS